MVGIDHVQELVDFSEENIRKNHDSLIDRGNIKLVGILTDELSLHMSLSQEFSVGDGREGYTAEGPYNAIHVGAAAATLPQAVKKSMREVSL